MRPLILCTLIAISAQLPPKPVPSTPPARDPVAEGTVKEGTAVIRGRVTDAETGQPVERMVVAAVSPDLQRIDRTWTRQAVTDAQGRYELAKLPAGPYYVGASAGEFKVWYLGQQYGAAPGSLEYGLQGKRLDLADGEVRPGIDLALTRALGIAGRVVDEFGDPLANVSVIIERQGRRVFFAMTSDRATDDHGVFRLFGLPPGEYRVCANPRAMVVGNPKERLVRTCYPSAVDEAEAELVKLTAADVGDIEIRVARGRTYTISGGVVSTSGSTAGIAVAVSRLERNGISGAGGVEAKPDGQFVVRGLSPGQYVVHAIQRRGAGAQDSTIVESGTASVRIDNADVEDVTVVLSPPVTVRGRILFEDAVPPSSLGQMTVTTPFDRFSGSMSLAPPQSVKVKDDMTFELTRLFGPQIVTSLNNPRGWYLKQVRYNGNDITDVATEFKTGEGLELVLSTKGAELTGRIVDDNGNLLTECQCQVFMFSTDSRRWKSRMSTTGQPTIEKDGTFKISDRRQGEYFIAAVSYDFPLVELDESHFAAIAKGAERVMLFESDRKTIDLHVLRIP